jgi:hypothetical protein
MNTYPRVRSDTLFGSARCALPQPAALCEYGPAVPCPPHQQHAASHQPHAGTSLERTMNPTDTLIDITIGARPGGRRRAGVGGNDTVDSSGLQRGLVQLEVLGAAVRG